MSKHKYKIGDKVRVIDVEEADAGEVEIGDIALVTKLSSNGDVYIGSANKNRHWMYAAQIEPAETHWNTESAEVCYPTSVENTLQERGKRYGEFKYHSRLAQNLKLVMRGADSWESLSSDKKEALEMIQHKVARILNGDPGYKDNWHDIAGYAKLAEDLCPPTEEE